MPRRMTERIRVTDIQTCIFRIYQTISPRNNWRICFHHLVQFHHINSIVINLDVDTLVLPNTKMPKRQSKKDVRCKSK